MRPADFEGVGTGDAQWKAWEMKDQRKTEAEAASLGAYLLFCPGAHPFWRYHVIGMCHLRPIPNVKPAHLRTPTSTHEILCVALNPDYDRVLDPDVAESVHMMTPPNFVIQVESLSDEAAVQLLRSCARAVMSGKVSPDSDFRSWWEDSIRKTADCMRAGKHLPS